MSSRSEPRRLRLGLPKGSLQATTEKLFKLAGFDLRVASRSYYPDIDDVELDCILIRAQEMARYVQQGVLDAGITGLDWTLENKAKVKEIADLEAPWPNYNPVRWVVAVKEDSLIVKPSDLAGKRIATEVMNLTRRYLKGHGITDAKIEFSWGATEVKPPVLADAILDVTETGASLRANDLEVLDVVIESTPRFIANQEAAEDPWKRAKMEQLRLLMLGAIAAASQVNLSMNVPRDRLSKVLELLPALNTPTLAPLADDSWVEVTTVVEEKPVREIIVQLADAGARGIIETALTKIVH